MKASGGNAKRCCAARSTSSRRRSARNNPWFVSVLTTLGNLRDGAGDLDDEEAIVRRALAITEKIEDTNSMQYASLLNNLGEVYRQKQDYARAEEVLQRSLALEESLVGPENYSVAARSSEPRHRRTRAARLRGCRRVQHACAVDQGARSSVQIIRT